MARRAVARLVLALCAVALLQPARHLCALAEEGEEPAIDDAVADAAAAPSGEEPIDPANFVESAKELQDKLGQLQALLDAKNENADPALKERLAGLKEQLSKLNLPGLDLGGGGSELSELVGSCAALSMRRAGMSRASTMSQLRRLAGGKLSQSQAADMELARMIAVCAYDLSSEELQLFKTGKLSMLPATMAEKAASDEAKEMVTGMEADMWNQVQEMSKGLLEQLAGNEKDSGLPMKWGILAALPLLWIFAFLGKKFMDMQKRHEGRKDKSKKKSK